MLTPTEEATSAYDVLPGPSSVSSLPAPKLALPITTTALPIATSITTTGLSVATSRLPVAPVVTTSRISGGVYRIHGDEQTDEDVAVVTKTVGSRGQVITLVTDKLGHLEDS